MAGDLASWEAKCKVMRDLGVDTLPKGKRGNCITRMWARTGWWPLVRESENWSKAIGQFDVSKPAVCRVTKHVDLTNELGPEVRIRQVVLNAFRSSFLHKAEIIKKEYKDKTNRRKSNVPNTVFGKGFTKAEDLTVVKANDIRLEQIAEDKVGVCVWVGGCA